MGKHNTDGHVPGSIARAARALLNISQDEAAAQIGISPGTLRRLESGIAMSARSDKKLVAFLKKSPLVCIYRDGKIAGLAEGDGDTDDVILEAKEPKDGTDPQ